MSLVFSTDDSRVRFPAEFPRHRLFRRRQTRSPERHERVPGLQHRHSAVGRGRERPPEDGGGLPEAAAGEEEGARPPEAVVAGPGGPRRCLRPLQLCMLRSV